MLGGVGFVQPPTPSPLLPILPNSNPGSAWNPNLNNGVNFRNGFLGLQTPQTSATNQGQTIGQSLNWQANNNFGNKLLDILDGANKNRNLNTNFNRNTNVNNQQHFGGNGNPAAAGRNAGAFQQSWAGNNQNQNQFNSGQQNFFSGQQQQKQNDSPFQTRLNELFNNGNQNSQQQNSFLSSNQNDNKNETSNQGSGNSWFFHQNNNNSSDTNHDGDNNDDKFNDDQNNSTSLADEFEKMKEEFEEQLEKYGDWLEEEKERKEDLERIQRYALLIIPFFIFDRETASYFAATELFSVYLEDLGFNDELNTLMLLFVQCVDIRAFSRGRFRLVDGYQTNWYQELYDYILTKAGIDDRIRLGSQMFMPQSPMPEYEDKKRRKKRHIEDFHERLINFAKIQNKVLVTA